LPIPGWTAFSEWKVNRMNTSTSPSRTIVGRTGNGGLFRTADGKNLAVTFVLITSLFLLWGFCIAAPFMGHVADLHSMRIGFVVPLVCFVFVALYGYMWPRLCRLDS